MITELIFSAVALVFYFGIERYYKYKDKGSNDDFVVEPPKEVINVGDSVLVFRTSHITKNKYHHTEGVVTEKAQDGTIKIGRFWYGDRLNTHGDIYTFTKVEKVIKPTYISAQGNQGSVIYNSRMELILEIPTRDAGPK